jgi:hypothetical protein
MLLISLGPRPDVYLAYAPEQPTKLPAGTTGVPKEVSVFYGETRGRVFPWTFSLVSIIAPIVIFAAATRLAVKMFNASQLAAGFQSSDRLPVADICGLPALGPQLQVRAFAGMIPFAATHIALLAVCVVAYGVSVVCMHNVLDTHKVLGEEKLWGWAVPIAVPLVAAGVVFGSASFFLGSDISYTSSLLFPFPKASDCRVFETLESLKRFLDQQARMGVFFLIVGVISLISASAVLAYRFETRDPNGAWSNSYVLRHKLSSALTLSFIGSIMLVSYNIALSSALDWWGDGLQVVYLESASNVSSGGDSGSDAPNGKTSSPAEAALKCSVTPNAFHAAFCSFATARKSLSKFAGGLGSLILAAILAATFYILTTEIILAGKCHAYYDSQLPKEQGEPRPDPHQPIYMASWDTVTAWKDRHGLNMSYAGLTGSLLAVLAPLLSSGAIDLARMIPGAGH